jgi:hypothetical protein
MSKLTFMVMALMASLRLGAQPAPTNAAVPPAGGTNGIVTGPGILFLETIHDFGKVQAGQNVKHDFIFTNMGSATLEIADARASCGCVSVVEFDRKVEPGRTGRMQVQFSSGNMNGPVSKHVSVASNDRRVPTAIVQVRAHVWKPVLVEPSMGVFSLFGPPSTNDAKTFRITNNMPEPLVIQSVQVSSRLFSAQLATNHPGREYWVTVRPTGPLPPGVTQATVTIKPASTNTLPMIVTIVASVQEPIMVLPSQLTLPAGPLSQGVTKSVLIRNIHPNPIVLSNAVINVPNIEVQLAENHPGHTFTVALTFPAGFEIGAGREVALSVQSSYPGRPFIKVPIIQEPGVAAPVPAPSATGR